MRNKLKTSIRLFGGVPTIHVNGTPVTGLMHWNRNMQTEDVRLFAEAGVRIFSFIGNFILRKISGTIFSPMKL